MAHYEYKVVPAPLRGRRVKGVKSSEARVAYTLSALMSELGHDGWEYQQAETMAIEERSGLFALKRKTHERNMLIFRRAVVEEDAPARPPAESDRARESPERIADAAAASLSADPEARPARASEGDRRPFLGPARGEGVAAPRRPTGAKAE